MLYNINPSQGPPYFLAHIGSETHHKAKQASYQGSHTRGQQSQLLLQDEEPNCSTVEVSSFCTHGAVVNKLRCFKVDARCVMC